MNMSKSSEKRGTGARLAKRALPVVLLAGLVLFFVSGAHNFLSFSRLAEHYSLLKSFVETAPLLSVLGFAVAYILTTALSLPIASVLTLVGGALLGWGAAAVIICSATIGATIVFLAARTVLNEFLRRRTSGFMAKLEAGFQRNAFSYLLALRLIPAAPFWVVNIVPALLGMRLNHYVAATFIGIAPGTVIYVWVARSFDILLSRGQTPDLSVLREPAVITPLFALGVLSLLPALLQRLKSRHHSAARNEVSDD